MAFYRCGSSGGSNPLAGNMYAYSSYSGFHGQGVVTLNQAITLTHVRDSCAVFNIAGLGVTTMRIAVNAMYLSVMTITDGAITTSVARYVSNNTDITVTDQDLVVIGGRQDTDVDMTVTFS